LGSLDALALVARGDRFLQLRQRRPAIAELLVHASQHEQDTALFWALSFHGGRGLERARGRIYGPDGAAKLVGIKPTTLVSRLQALGLRHPATRQPE
jgi:hypothetical protein